MFVCLSVFLSFAIKDVNIKRGADVPLFETFKLKLTQEISQKMSYSSYTIKATAIPTHFLAEFLR